jgi:hypothetical protein
MHDDRVTIQCEHYDDDDDDVIVVLMLSRRFAYILPASLFSRCSQSQLA